MPNSANTHADPTGLTLRRDVFASPARYAAYAALLGQVFGISREPPGAGGPTWRPLGYFDEAGGCAATLELADLTLATADGARKAAGVRLVGVAESWRGHGLCRALMEHAIRECADHDIDLMLLFAENMDLYRRYGFEPVPQHAFAGPAPSAIDAASALTLDVAGHDRHLVERLLAVRAPVSGQVALIDAPSLFLARVTADGPALAYLPDDDALALYEVDDDTLVLVDLVAEAMPTLARVLGALRGGHARVVTLFPPDRLDWPAAAPIPEDTGLMARGPLPPAMRRPFMLPPTADF